MKLRMRTKFLLSMLLISASLTSTSLLLVRHSIQRQVRKEIFADLQNSVATFRNFQRERELTLTHAADLLADLPNLRALMTTQHDATIQDASRDLWRLAGSDLFLLADRTGRVVALHTSSPGLSRETAQQSFTSTLNEDSPEHWWLGSQQLYEVFRRPIYFGAPAQNRLLGFLAIGYEIDEKVASQVSRIATSQVAFYYGDRVVRSTLAPAQKSELAAAPGVLNKGSSEPEEVQLGNERYLLRSVQLAPDRNPPVELSVFKSYDEATGFLNRLNRLLLALGLIAVLGGSALVFVISDTFTRPLGSLVNGVRALEKGDYTYALDGRGGDEVAELTGAFQRMRDSLLNTQRELLEAERLATIGRMASSISHDLRHALAAIVANAEFLCESRLSSEQREELYQEVRVAVNQMTDLLDSLLEFSRTRESLRPSYSDLRNSIEHVVQTIRSHPEFHPIAIEIRQEGDASGWFDSKKLERAFYNLLLNACESVAADNGRIEIVLRSIPGAVDIRLSDNGHGVPDSIRRELFEPFVSYGKENGTGLGLTVVQKIVQDHGGEINIEKTSAEGTTFRMLLPTGCSPKSPASQHEGMADLPSFTQPEKARSE